MVAFWTHRANSPERPVVFRIEGTKVVLEGKILQGWAIPTQ